MQARLEAFAAANVQLVKKVPQQFFDEVGTRVVQASAPVERAEDLQQDIEDRYGVSESRARLIARDQVGKLYGELNKARQQDLGIERFTWRTVGDERVRPSTRCSMARCSPGTTRRRGDPG
jgi:SPP1 gp7 family putative phage head morphogenesis protein